jgi:hypothetical protein
MDIATIGSLLSSLKTATEIAKFVKDADLSIEKAETKFKLAELVSALVDAKLEAAEIQQAILERDERIRELEKEAKIRANLRWREPCYWLPNSEAQEEPYCQHCYDGSQKLVRLHSDNAGLYQCRVCDNSFSTHARRERDSTAFRNARGTISRGLA